MGFLPDLFSRNAIRSIILIEIGSRGVSTAIIRSGEETPLGHQASVLASSHTPFRVHRTLDPKAFTRTALGVMEEALEKLAVSARTTEGVRDADVVCTVSAPWHVSKTITMSTVEEKPFDIRGDILESLIARATESFLEESGAEKGESPNVLIEQQVIDVLVNGYRTAKPVGKRGRSLDASVYLAVMARSVQDRMREIIERAFPNRPIHFRSSSLVVFSTLRDMFPAYEDFLIVRVSGELTEISIVRDGVLRETGTFPFGSHFLLRSIMANQPAIDTEAAHSLFRIVTTGQASTPEANATSRALTNARTEWLGAMGRVLAPFAEEMPLPNTAFLVVDDEFLAWFTASLTDPSLSPLTLAQEPFRASVVRSDVVRTQVTFEQGSHPDPRVALAALQLTRVALARR